MNHSFFFRGGALSIGGAFLLFLSGCQSLPSPSGTAGSKPPFANIQLGSQVDEPVLHKLSFRDILGDEVETAFRDAIFNALLSQGRVHLLDLYERPLLEHFREVGGLILWDDYVAYLYYAREATTLSWEEWIIGDTRERQKQLVNFLAYTMGLKWFGDLDAHGIDAFFDLLNFRLNRVRFFPSRDALEEDEEALLPAVMRRSEML
jgi:hypothetical protein